MYLTRMYLDPRRIGAQRLLASPQRLHAATMACFAEQPVPPPSDSERVLWRTDTDNPNRPVLWIVSPAQPDPGRIGEDDMWKETGVSRPETRPYEPLLNRLGTGQRYAFQLTANPTYSIPSPKPDDDPMALLTDEPQKRPRGKRVPHTTASHQLDWLTKRSETAGFRILPSSACLSESGEQALQVQLKAHGTAKFSKECDKDKNCPVCSKNRKHSVSIVRATYVGALEVTDPDALRQTLCQGLGRARAYGCGLLTLAPLHSPHK